MAMRMTPNPNREMPETPAEPQAQAWGPSPTTCAPSAHLRGRKNVTRGALAVLFAIAASPLFAQYAPGMDGRAMDANNQIGSGGLNSPVQQRLFNAGNLYITGNVTGGRTFQGFSPIRNPSSLFTALPSTRLSGFQRDTVGLNNVLRRPAYGQTNPFFYSSNTVTSVGGIVAGRNLPGSSIPRTSSTMPLGNPLGNTGNASTTPLNLGYGYQSPGLVVPSSSLYNRDNLDILRNSALSERLRLGSETATLQYQAPTSPYENRSSTSSWNNQPPTLYDPVAATTRSLNPLPLDPFVRQPRAVGGEAARPRSEDMLARAQQLLSPTAIAPKLFNKPLAERPRDTLTGRPLPEGPAFQATPGDLPADPRILRDEPARMAGRQLNASPYGRTSHYGSELDGGNSLANLQAAYAFLLDTAASSEEASQSSEIPSDRKGYEHAIAIVRHVSEKDVRSFAKAVDQRVSNLVVQAEAELHQGRYYRAASLYRLAAATAPDDPLIRLGGAHALLAAGEYLTALFELTSAIDAYPAFGLLRIDLNAFVPDANVLDLRRADLERKLDRKEDYRLRFLLGYLEYYDGLAKFGLPDLQKAAQEAPAGSTVARFPEMLKAKERFPLNPPDKPGANDVGKTETRP